MANLQEALSKILRSKKPESDSDGANEFSKRWGGKQEPPVVLSDAQFRELTKLGLRRVQTNQVEIKPVISPPMLVQPKVQKLAVKTGSIKPAIVIKPTPSINLHVGPGASYRLKCEQLQSIRLLPHVGVNGQAEQCLQSEAADTRELAFGLDFGTSSVKVVVGDAALDKAFAVPFCQGKGIEAFLLPTRLYQSAEKFSLDDGQEVHRDLKLSFVADPTNPDYQTRIVAFLALVINNARGWLFSKHLATYKNTKILWKLSIGLPAASSLESDVTELLRKLVHLAWRFAGDLKTLNTTSIKDALTSFSAQDVVDSKAEVSVVPEIAAQIYGFVVSNSFDKMAANNYLMVDVGAGTVDSSLFHVKPGKGGKWDFEFYTAAVEPLGVANLHRHRVNWWSDALKECAAPGSLVDDLLTSKLGTDQQSPLPESYENYFEGVQIQLHGGAVPPDEDFFLNRVVTQVRGKTMWRAWKNGLLPKQAITKIPFFMCGGGARMNYYLELERELEPQPGFNWLQAEAWTLGVPGDLIADDLPNEDFDRVSVAYGLSRLEVGKVIKAAPMPRVTIEPVDTWRDHYVGKDQC